MRTAPCAVIGAGVRVVVSDLNPARSLTTANHHIRRIGEIPHDLLRALRVIRVLRCLRSIPRCSRDEIVGDIIVIPPESPTIVEVNGLPVRAGHVDNYGRVIRNVVEFEINSRVFSPEIQIRSRQVEYLHAFAGISAGKGNQLFVFQLAPVERKGVTFVPVLSIVVFVNRIRIVRWRITCSDFTGCRQLCSGVQIRGELRNLLPILGIVHSIHIGQVVGLVPCHQAGIGAKSRGNITFSDVVTAQSAYGINGIITAPNAGFVASQRSLVPVAVCISSIRLAQPARRTPCANLLGAHHGRASIAADHQSCLAIGGTEL